MYAGTAAVEAVLIMGQTLFKVINIFYLSKFPDINI